MRIKDIFKKIGQEIKSRYNEIKEYRGEMLLPQATRAENIMLSKPLVWPKWLEQYQAPKAVLNYCQKCNAEKEMKCYCTVKIPPSATNNEWRIDELYECLKCSSKTISSVTEKGRNNIVLKTVEEILQEK